MCRKDWIFGVLYAASQDSSAPRCTIVVPLTLLFKDGLPEKVLITDTLKKCVRGFPTPFHNASVIATIPPPGTKEGKALRRKCLRYCKEMLQEYSEQNGFAAIQHGNSDEPFVVSVTYMDGEREDLSLPHFERLYRNDGWCQQLILAQGFVPYRTLEVGTYMRRARVRSRIEAHASEAADQLTRSLAGFVDQVYAISTENAIAANAAANPGVSDSYMDWTQGKNAMETLMANQSTLLAAEKKMAEQRKETMRLADMKASFGLDHHDRVVLLSVDMAVLESADMVNNSSSMNRAMKQDLKATMETEISATVTKDLLKMLTQARQKGLDDVKSFAHFDTSHTGIVDVDDLVDGLARLGIGVSQPVADLILQNIAGVGSGLITLTEFVKFLNRMVEVSATTAESQLNLKVGLHDIDTTVAGLATHSGTGSAGSMGTGMGGMISPLPTPTPSKKKAKTTAKKKSHKALSEDEYSPLRPPLKPGFAMTPTGSLFKPRKQARVLPPLVSRSLDFEAGAEGAGGTVGAGRVGRRKRKLRNESQSAVSKSTSKLDLRYGRYAEKDVDDADGYDGYGGGDGSFIGGYADGDGGGAGTDEDGPVIHSGLGGIDGERWALVAAESEESDATAEDEISLLNSQMQFSFFPQPPPPGEDIILGGVFGPNSLPTEEDDYRIRKPVESAVTGGYGVLDLPPWARESQKRALKEIRETHKRWKRKKREEGGRGVAAAEAAARERAENGDDEEDENEGGGGAAVAGTLAAQAMNARLVAAAACTERWEARSLTLLQTRPEGGHSHSHGGHSRTSHSHGGHSHGGHRTGAHSTTHSPVLSPTHWSLPSAATTAFNSRPTSHANTPRNDPPLSCQREPLRTTADEHLPLGHGVVMTYRVVDGAGSLDPHKTHEEVYALRHRSILELREANIKRVHVEGTSRPGSGNGRGHNAAAATAIAQFERKQMDDAAAMMADFAKPHPQKNNHSGGGAGEGMGSGTGALGALRGGSADGLRGTDESQTTSALGAGPDGDGPPNTNRWIAFTLVVVPDLFTTLDALEAHFKPLLVKFPLARLVLVGLPGLPNTLWPTHWTLNPDLHARSIAKLLQHLHATHRLGPAARLPAHMDRAEGDAEPVFFMGLGVGGYSLAQFATVFLPPLLWLKERARVVILVNSVLKLRPFQKLCKEVHQGLLMASHGELTQRVAALHFWEEHLAKNGKQKCLDEFWSTREGLSTGGVSADHAGTALVGVLGQLKGLLAPQADAFDGSALLRTDLPVVVVQSTEDAFVSPKNAVVFQADRLPPHRSLVTFIADSLDPGAVHVTWLRAGHEVLQERTEFLLGVVGNLAQLCGAPAWGGGGTPPRTASRGGALGSRGGGVTFDQEDDEMFDVLKLAEGRAEKRTAEREAAEAARAAAERDKKSLKRAKRDAKMAAKEAERVEAEAGAARRLAKETAAADAAQREGEWEAAEKAALRVEAEQRALKARLEGEREANAARLAERQRRREDQVREQMLQELHTQSQEYLDELRSHHEWGLMEREDFRSQCALQYHLYEEACAHTLAVAAQRTGELFASRRAAALQRVEDRLARAQLVMRFEMKTKAHEALQEMVADDLHGFDADLQAYASSADPDINKVIASARYLLDNFMQCREKYLEVLRRQRLAQEKLETFTAVMDAMFQELQSKRVRLSKLRKKQREARVKKSGPSKAHLERGAEIDRMVVQISEEEAHALEVMAVARQRQAHVETVNASAQRLKVLVKEKDERIIQYVGEMQAMENHMLRQIKTIKVEKQYMTTFKDKSMYQLQLKDKHILQLKKERARLRHHPGHFIDTTMWTEGVVYRTETVPFRKYLVEEISRQEDLRGALLEELEGHRLSVLACSMKFEKIKCEGDKLTIALKILKKTYALATRLTMVEMMRESLQLQAEAASKAEEQAREAAELAVLNSLGCVTLADRVRKKDYESRTSEERRFIALELVLRPELYADVSLMDAEQMQFDEVGGWVGGWVVVCVTVVYEW